MDKEEIKNRIDFNNVKEYIEAKTDKIVIKKDYLVDSDGKYIVPLTPLDVKLIEKIKELELRIKKLEEKTKV